MAFSFPQRLIQLINSPHPNRDAIWDRHPRNTIFVIILYFFFILVPSERLTLFFFKTKLHYVMLQGTISFALRNDEKKLLFVLRNVLVYFTKWWYLT